MSIYNHGTRTAYQYGCKCDACREANAAYRAAWIERPGRRERVRASQRRYDERRRQPKRPIAPFYRFLERYNPTQES